MIDPRRFIAFSGSRKVAEGPLEEVLAVLKERFDLDRNDDVLLFDVETGRQRDVDLRGTLGDVLARECPDAVSHRGPGRPKLGVVSREVSLLPRHWEWLEEQPNGASAALRRLVDEVRKRAPGSERARRIRAATSRFLTMMAGDRPGFEEATRALFAGDTAGFEKAVARWPKDLREHVIARAQEAIREEAA